MLVGCDYTYKLGTCLQTRKVYSKFSQPLAKVDYIASNLNKGQRTLYFMAIGKKVSGRGFLGSFEKQSVVLVAIISIQS